jgi:hypothetical protein
MDSPFSNPASTRRLASFGERFFGRADNEDNGLMANAACRSREKRTSLSTVLMSAMCHYRKSGCTRPGRNRRFCGPSNRAFGSFRFRVLKHSAIHP